LLSGFAGAGFGRLLQLPALWGGPGSWIFPAYRWRCYSLAARDTFSHLCLGHLDDCESAPQSRSSQLYTYSEYKSWVRKIRDERLTLRWRRVHPLRAVESLE